MGMSKQDRLFYILNLLQARKNLNAEKLAVECGVTERSIYRDIVALSEANIPIYYDNGYKLASNNFLPPFNFDFEEYLCIRLAIESCPLNETGKYRRILQKVRAKIETRLSDTVRDRSRFSPQTTHVDIPVSQEQERGEEFYGRIEQAADTCHCLKLKYDSVKSGLSERIVEPYFIIFKGRAFYFVAFCRLRNELRTFRLDRVVGIELTGDRFVRRNDVTPESYFDQSWLVYSGDPVKVVVHFTGDAARVVQSGKHHPDESIRDLGNGKVEYTVVTRGLDEIQRWILGFGRAAIVISPPQLRENLAVIGHYLDKTYNL